ncbi:pirin family protein [Vibrio sp. SCSIO 43137]|uniref:pirin family protein n=1 Tax=Vibrio sp. SCSIO 43137 TaxID=3021011 RepID=UPI002307A7D2|nr:pirin family protein [Vibrio sp. SCSIO 43137]WCE30568.1 pirin family protein [Vibrio sp. SCSIO 43137]
MQNTQNQYRIKPAESLHYLPHSNMHPSDTYFHFSFANYYDPTNMRFSLLRVLNDDAIAPHSGFGKHPHKDMQIVSYIIDGQLTHWDNVTNKEETIGAGHVQAISAGSGVWHSEKNLHDTPCRLLQIWLLPPHAGGEVRYSHKKFEAEERQNRLLHIVGNPENKQLAPLYVNADCNIYVSELTGNEHSVSYKVNSGRQVYINCIDGELNIDGKALLKARDSVEIKGSQQLVFRAENSAAHLILIDLPQE